MLKVIVIVASILLLMLRLLHDLSKLQHHVLQGIRYSGSCRIFSTYPINPNATPESMSFST